MELNEARENKAEFRVRVDMSWSELYRPLNEKILGSAAFNIRLSIQKIRLEHKLRLNAKLKKLLVRQDRPLRQDIFDSITIFYGFNFPIFVKYLCSYGPKHQIRDNFNEVHFLADIDKRVRALRESGTDVEKL